MSLFGRAISIFTGRSKPPEMEAAPCDAPPDKPYQAPEGPIRRWQPELERMSAELTDVSHKTENEFLEIGRNLQNFSESCTANSTLSAEIISMVEGGKGHDFSAFEGLFESAYEHTGACAGAISQGLRDIAGLKKSIGEMADLQSFLRHLSKSINIVGVLSRIETARIEGAEFSSMTSVVDDLAQQIVKSTGEIAASANDIVSSISTTGETMHGKLDGFMKKLDSAREHVSGIILEMNTMKTKSTWACKRIEGRSSQIIPAISEIIGLLQCHDMCRQRMEHAGRALTDISSRMGSMGEMATGEKIAVMRWVPGVLAIQTSQLANVIEDTNGAAEGVSTHLTRISDLSEAQTEDAAMILEEEESGGLRLEKIAAELENLLLITFECREMTNEMIRAVSEVSLKIEKMSDHTSHIVLISENINLLAMNAIIRVSHTGDSGRALGVLANKISGLSKLATEEIVKGSAKIKDILSRTTAFRDGLSTVLNGQLVTADEIVSQTRRAADELLESDKTLVKSMHEVSALTNSLKRDISQVVSGIQFDRTIKSATDEVIAALQSMGKEIIDTLPAYGGDVSDDFSKELADISRRYTMESERAVHNAVLAGACGTEPQATGCAFAGKAAEGQSGNELGENVELF